MSYSNRDVTFVNKDSAYIEIAAYSYIDMSHFHKEMSHSYIYNVIFLH